MHGNEYGNGSRSPRRPNRLWSGFRRLWLGLDRPTRDAAHDVHERKEELFARFFERHPIGRWIDRYTNANQWSIARFPLSGVLLATLLSRNLVATFVVILIIGFTDLIDGPLARYQGTASPGGTRLESLADSVCLWTMFIAMFFLTKSMPLRWLFGTAGILELIRLGGVAYYEKRVNLKALAPNQSGKYKMNFYVAGALGWAIGLQGLTVMFLAVGVYLSFHSLLRHRFELEAMLREQR